APLVAPRLTPARAPRTSVSSETGLIAGRTREDRTKSPGFYSNMAPAYGAHTVSPSLGQGALKRTVVGLAPPHDPAHPGDAPAKVSPGASAGKARGADANGASSAALLAPRGADAPASSSGGEPASAAESLGIPAANDVTSVEAAPARAAADEAEDGLEKE